jgi:hypothetical protein
VHNAGDGSKCSRADVGGGASDGAGGGNSTEERGEDVGDALGNEFDIGVMTVAGHAVGNDGGEEAFDGAEESDGEGGWEQRKDVFGMQVGQGDVREALGDAAES